MVTSLALDAGLSNLSGFLEKISTPEDISTTEIPAMVLPGDERATAPRARLSAPKSVGVSVFPSAWPAHGKSNKCKIGIIYKDLLIFRMFILTMGCPIGCYRVRIIKGKKQQIQPKGKIMKVSCSISLTQKCA